MAAEGRGPGQTGASRPLRLLVFSASLRADSLNTRLATLAATTIEAQGHTADVASMAEFDAASYNGDVDAAVGLPPGAENLRRRLEAAH
ncbi:MAG TPA: NAD(P)H-dependent oxidoreductase, partial [Candidatus Dormibacteraeota bacterium]|nr:NAD(P)H-dependent oxidoreductase [Candidatus Dormibacteraeota bacterium]